MAITWLPNRSAVRVYEVRLVAPLDPSDDEVMQFADYAEARKAYLAARAEHRPVTLSRFPLE